jgi:hypothetical protein
MTSIKTSVMCPNFIDAMPTFLSLDDFSAIRQAKSGATPLDLALGRKKHCRHLMTAFNAFLVSILSNRN